MIELTYEVEDSTGETECFAIEVEVPSITTGWLRALIVADFDERSASFADFAQDATQVRIDLGGVWLTLDSPQSVEQTSPVVHTMEGRNNG